MPPPIDVGEDARETTLRQHLEAMGSAWFALCSQCSILEKFNCPLTKTPMSDPVIAADGHTYSRAALKWWFHSQKNFGLPILSPLEHEPMETSTSPDENMRSALSEVVLEYRRMMCEVEQGKPTHAASIPLVRASSDTTLTIELTEEVVKHSMPVAAPIGFEQQGQPESAMRRQDLGELREAFTKLDSLREVLKETLEGWDPPSITVIGTRSVGKSSLLERLAMMPLFPRNPSICTRLPIHVRLRQCDPGDHGHATLVVEDAQTGALEGEPRLIPIQSGARFVEEVQERIRAENKDTDGISVTKRIIVELHHPNVPTIDLVDTPGLEAMPGQAPATRQILESQLAQDRARGNNTIYLLIVAAAGRFQVNDQAAAFVEEHALHERALGVFTKCDELPPKLYSHLRKMVEDPSQENNGMRLAHGWVATMNSDDYEELPGQERLMRQMQDELSFFSSHSDLQALEAAGDATSSALIHRLKLVYMRYLHDTWVPKTLRKIHEKGCEARFEELRLCGRSLSQSAEERNAAARAELGSRLSQAQDTLMTQYLAEEVRPFREALVATLKGIATGEGVPMEAFKMHFAHKKAALTDLWRAKMKEITEFWEMRVHNILTATCEVEESDAGLFSFNMVTHPGETLQHFFSGRKKPSACRKLEEMARVHLHEYPDFIESVMEVHRNRLRLCIEQLQSQLTHFDNLIDADIHGSLVSCIPSEDLRSCTFRIDVKKVTDNIIMVLMVHGPTASLITGLEKLVTVGSEIEKCSADRDRYTARIEKLKQARIGVQNMFGLSEEDVRALELLDDDAGIDEAEYFDGLPFIRYTWNGQSRI
ncbi:hypothetical protein CYMTET_24941 [Cymbomonas tetramitiformis]|uniref:U-box domain-containing protein n=1 Tax=Cymbomonas tetramitiformis TaxID=36881 RepID=A0AAE0FWB8_9CHLO|nr:hypothetical protein CYMTET_24941 [Cymbomonas tetramitiformis]